MTTAGKSKSWFGKHALKFTKKAIAKSVQQQKKHIFHQILTYFRET